VASTQRGQRRDQAVLLGDAEELRRRQQPALGMLPAHQRLDAVGLAARQASTGW
jgi:hypothetical protein